MVRLGDLLTIQEAISRSGLAATTLYYHIREGSLAAYKMGNHMVVRRQDLDAFMMPEPVVVPPEVSRRGRPRRRREPERAVA